MPQCVNYLSSKFVIKITCVFVACLILTLQLTFLSRRDTTCWQFKQTYIAGDDARTVFSKSERGASKADLLVKEYPMSTNLCASLARWRAKTSPLDRIPTLYVITPTYNRKTQLPDIVRLKQTLMLVPNCVWIVVEDANKTNPEVFFSSQ